MNSDLPAPGLRQQIATRLVFLLAGFGMAAWAPLVPYAKDRAGIDDGVLGMLLLCLGAGSILAMPMAGILSARHGCRRVILVSVGVFAAALPFLAWASSLPALMFSLFVFGMGIGSLDVSMNVFAVIVEKASGRSMMSGFHGMFSLGGILGAGAVTGLLALKLAPLHAIWVVLGVVGLALWVAAPSILPYGGSSDGPLFAMPRGIVLLIGAVCFVVFLMEGSVLDWSAEFLTSPHHHMPKELGGLGYAAFAATMTVGRLAGDWMVQRFGGSKLVFFGGVVAAAGAALTLVPSWPLALVGYSLVGIGCSNIVPVMFSAAGRQTIMPENLAVPAITTLGYTGILAGPAVIGFVSEASSLSVAFALLAVLLLGVAVSARFLRL